MARKRALVSWLPTTAADAAPIAASIEAQLQAVMQTLGKAGIAAEALPWNRDLAKVGWAETADRIIAEPPALWLIVGNTSDFADPDLRQGLSLAQIAITAKSPAAVTTILAGLDGDPVAAVGTPGLPSMLQRAQLLAPPVATWGARLVALAHRPTAAAATEDFRLSLIAHPALGLWFEVGPAAGNLWQGAIFGVDGGEITHQGVGPAGVLPERCTLEYPSRGIEVQSATDPFTCWAVQNALDTSQSHFVRVLGNPGRILFGPLPQDDAPALAILTLR